MKLFFERDVPKANLRTPRPTVLPAKNGLTGSALYRHSRLGGDFFDFVPISPTRVLFLLSDIAGKRDEALHIAAILQDALLERAPALLKDEDANLSDGVTELALDLNRTIIQAAGGVRPAPTFIGCLDEQFGLIHYISAGHPPAYICSDGEITQLDPTGLPFGLFSHATHDAAVSVVPPGSSVVLVSKGVVESTSGRHEFGAARVRQFLEEHNFLSPQHLCRELLDTAVKFAQQPSSFGPQFSIAGFRSAQEPNDMTVLCLMRAAKIAAASA
ncbi:MAG TPA: SpoIIE family protein phosphatase [Terriglobales bacterium]|nr:SpoIIE family protein phosphatase [Terriglobales bacterium]